MELCCQSVCERFMAEEETDVKFVERIKHPKFAHAEDNEFKDFTMAQRDDSQEDHAKGAWSRRA